MPPLRGLVPLVLTLLHRCRPYGTEEGFWRVQSSWLKPGAVENSAYRAWDPDGYLLLN